MKKISTDLAPKAIGAYSQAIMNNGTLFVSGQIPFDPKTGLCVSEDIKAQTLRSLENVKAIVEAAGLKIENIVKCSVFTTNMDDYSSINEVYNNFFGEHKPARTLVEVSRLPRDVKIEIEAIAVKE